MNRIKIICDGIKRLGSWAWRGAPSPPPICLQRSLWRDRLNHRPRNRCATCRRAWHQDWLWQQTAHPAQGHLIRWPRHPKSRSPNCLCPPLPRGHLRIPLFTAPESSCSATTQPTYLLRELVSQTGGSKMGGCSSQDASSSRGGVKAHSREEAQPPPFGTTDAPSLQNSCSSQIIDLLKQTQQKGRLGDALQRPPLPGNATPERSARGVPSAVSTAIRAASCGNEGQGVEGKSAMSRDGRTPVLSTEGVVVASGAQLPEQSTALQRLQQTAPVLTLLKADWRGESRTPPPPGYALEDAEARQGESPSPLPQPLGLRDWPLCCLSPGISTPCLLAGRLPTGRSGFYHVAGGGPGSRKPLGPVQSQSRSRFGDQDVLRRTRRPCWSGIRRTCM